MLTLIMILILPFEWYLIFTIFQGKYGEAKGWCSVFLALAILVPFQDPPAVLTSNHSVKSNKVAISASPTPKLTPRITKQPAGTWGEDKTTFEITGPLGTTSYWTKGGKSYHFNFNCPSLSRSKNILTGTLQDAFNDGKTDPCNICANGT